MEDYEKIIVTESAKMLMEEEGLSLNDAIVEAVGILDEVKTVSKVAGKASGLAKGLPVVGKVFDIISLAGKAVKAINSFQYKKDLRDTLRMARRQRLAALFGVDPDTAMREAQLQKGKSKSIMDLLNM